MTIFSKYNRLDLEQDLIKMWDVCEHLKEFSRQHIDKPKPMDDDEFMNKLLGIMNVHDMHCQRAWDGFEVMLKNGDFNKEFVNDGKRKTRSTGK